MELSLSNDFKMCSLMWELADHSWAQLQGYPIKELLGEIALILINMLP